MKFTLPGTRRGKAIGVGAVVATAALAVGGVVVANGADAATTSTTAAATRAQLIEMQTPAKKGYFYTASQAEFLSAQKHGFKFTNQVPGYVSTVAVRGTVPLYRLRSKSVPSYLVTTSAAERNKLAASGSWVYEGVTGRVPLAPAADRVQVYRVSKGGFGWRVVRAALVAGYKKAGWHIDGPLAYLWLRK
jgi:hypothetical protein